MKKVIIIENCHDCPKLQVFGREIQCDELGRMLKSPTMKIPKDCPLEDHVENEVS